MKKQRIMIFISSLKVNLKDKMQEALILYISAPGSPSS